MMKKRGFTLAEVLITLAIVGVVAAITMPALIANIQDRVRTARIQNIKQKFSKATDKMMSLSTLNGYSSTMEFVNELQNHLKIAKICDNQHLTECWPTEMVTIYDNKEWEISRTTEAKYLQMPQNSSSQYEDTVGIITADGTSMILTYNKKCDIDENKNISWSNDQSSTTGCIGAIFDWNGSKMPNKMGDDVIALNGASLGCIFELDGGCFKAPQPANKPLTYAECMAQKDDLGLDYCCDTSDCADGDYYAGAALTCGGKANMASMSDLAAIASDIYGTTIGEYENKSSISYSASIGSKYGFSDANSASFWVWSGRESDSSIVYNRGFHSTHSYWTYDYYRGFSSGLVLCKGD